MFSVLMSVYRGDDPGDVAEALASLVRSTVPVPELVIVQDFETSASVLGVIDSFKDCLPIRAVQLSSRSCLGDALNHGLQICSYDMVARFDSDDLNQPDRFRLQFEALKGDPSVSIIGGSIAEFDPISGPEHPYAFRTLPLSHEAILAFAKWRSPFNHMTVVYNRHDVLALGGYHSSYELEDYDLWVRLLHAGKRGMNLPETLVLARAGRELSKRRGGIRFLRAEFRVQTRFYQMGFLSPFQAVRNVICRGGIAIVPTWVRHLAYRFVLRGH